MKMLRPYLQQLVPNPDLIQTLLFAKAVVSPFQKQKTVVSNITLSELSVAQ